ncbi:MAG: hypothetical protein IPM59_01110 [Chloracidobacterium sp.]|nr:hypothetical protein [Chloracidobacterium sp.]
MADGWAAASRAFFWQAYGKASFSANRAASREEDGVGASVRKASLSANRAASREEDGVGASVREASLSANRAASREEKDAAE